MMEDGNWALSNVLTGPAVALPGTKNKSRTDIGALVVIQDFRLGSILAS